MEEIRQMKVEKTKEKESQHDLEHATDKEETPMGGGLQNVEQHFITIAEVAVLLKQEGPKCLRKDFIQKGLLIH